MSLPSVDSIIIEKGYNKTALTSEQQAEVLVAAVKKDLPLAIALLHAKAHEAERAGTAFWNEDPNSALGKQLIRIHASDALRPLVSKYFCHGQPLHMVNCCNGAVGKPPANILQWQIECQAGPIAYADC